MPSAVTPAPSASVKENSTFKIQNPGGDWRDELEKKGYAVVRGAVSPERAKYYQQKAFDWLKSFDPSLDLEDPSTWKTAHLPLQTDKNTYEHYSVVHEKFMWEARMEPGVLDAFAKLWGTDELLVSFDSLNVTLPNLKPPRAPWPHVDQAPRKRGMHCIQGIINLSHAGPEDGSLCVMDGSSPLVEQFFDTMTNPADWEWKDNRYFDDKDIAWFTERGVKPVRIQAEPGDLILWDSRCIHWGGEPTAKSNTIRTVIYAAYAPAKLATPEALAEKRRVFEANGATTHWPHTNIKLRDLYARLPDGTPDPRNRDQPLEPAEPTDQLLKLAGIKAY
ncbi:Phytanoyl-CoA dioxygenase [Niveomyces insectorum RCEF 264]|uniref:Phytanoyl-CoA dioxygenase n=1 Tax=Niveomyces insectorum RCEF 264 TaxID=1081102 RepID=A0A167ZXM6_9HYPO|nr:Phytanoyl-CoA dioxygenase [Niveomyces insectorum RCEF 264]